MSKSTKEAAQDRAIEFLSNRNFHQCFTLPADPSNNRSSPLRVSYASIGDQTSSSVVLFCGGLIGTRYCLHSLQHLAKKHRVRIIHPDRPGVGGSTPVLGGVRERVAAFLAIIPPLLDHLSITHIALAAHSCGAIYAFNVLTHPSTQKYLLRSSSDGSKGRPYVAFFAPWVHPRDSGKTGLNLVSKLPGSWIGNFHALASGINSYVMPVTGISGAVISTLLPGGKEVSAATDESPILKRDAHGAVEGAVDRRKTVGEKAFDDALEVLTMKYVFAEDLSGTSLDALLLLRKDPTVSWSADSSWDTYPEAVALLAEQQRKEEDANGRAGEKWKVDVFHAESDALVGKKGQKFFDECWSETRRGANVQYESILTRGTDHDRVLEEKFGASEMWLRRVAKSFGGEEVDDV